MLLPKKFVHDRMVLTLLSVSLALVVLTVLDVGLRLSQTTGDFIAQCRNCQESIPTFTRGSVVDIFSFIVAAILIFGASLVMSARTYRIHRQLAVIVIILNIILLLFNLRVVDALLGQR
jgi:uncharacterized protein (DUF983 family)